MRSFVQRFGSFSGSRLAGSILAGCAVAFIGGATTYAASAEEVVRDPQASHLVQPVQASVQSAGQVADSLKSTNPELASTSGPGALTATVKADSNNLLEQPETNSSQSASSTHQISAMEPAKSEKSPIVSGIKVDETTIPQTSSKTSSAPEEMQQKADTGNSSTDNATQQTVDQPAQAQSNSVIKTPNAAPNPLYVHYTISSRTPNYTDNTLVESLADAVEQTVPVAATNSQPSPQPLNPHGLLGQLSGSMLAAASSLTSSFFLMGNHRQTTALEMFALIAFFISLVRAATFGAWLARTGYLGAARGIGLLTLALQRSRKVITGLDRALSSFLGPLFIGGGRHGPPLILFGLRQQYLREAPL